jgi:tetratricopeptide (TPR) repeat protein
MPGADDDVAMTSQSSLLSTTLIVAGISIPLACLWSAGWTADAAGGPALVAPFAFARVALVHLAAVIPLAWVLASMSVAAVPRAAVFRRRATWLAILVAVLAGLLTSTFGRLLQPEVTSLPADWALAYRCVWSLLLTGPWVFAARYVSKSHAARATPVHLLLALIVYIVLPQSYTAHLLEERRQSISEDLALGRTWKAWQATSQVLALGSRAPVNGNSLVELRARLIGELRAYAAALQKPLPPDASFEDKLQRARIYTALDEMVEAQRILEPIAASSPSSLLLLAAVHDIQGNTEESIMTARRAIDMLLGDPSDAETQRETLRAFSWLAGYFRKAERYQEAEAALLDALQREQAPAAGLHFLLAEHYRMGGRPTEAFDHYAAAAIDAELQDRCTAAMKDLTLGTPVCILRPTKIATR